ncbi:MAG TPA: 50S ribosomal protein L29 [Gammaproteobacteria bacterium]|nr:50S ribosomal protein L29 [Gammaproteobacteria bacterium]|tara:strand:+ start:1999 stop:2187 length:189 start_codon:yes stop_codon:yes gene_type:complete
MKARELREKTGEQLHDLLLEKRREQFNLRMQAGSGQPPRSSDFREVRRDIARIKLILSEKNG